MAAARPFRAVHVSHRGAITVLCGGAEALELFTPEGERGWVADWSPDYLFRAGGGDEIDTVFRTQHGGERTEWIVLDHDLEALTLAYARLTPGSRVGTVTVSIEPIDDTSCWAEICYEMTATSEAGNATLRAFDSKAFAAMLADWEGRLAVLLAGHAPRRR